MGIHSVRAVLLLAAEKHVGHVATRLACHMASQTLDHEGTDGELANTFWAGRDNLAWGIGYLVSEYDRSDDGGRARNAAYAAVKRALAELVEAGIVELVQAGTGRHNSTYRLLVPAPPSRSQRRSPPVGIGAW